MGFVGFWGRLLWGWFVLGFGGVKGGRWDGRGEERRGEGVSCGVERV